VGIVATIPEKCKHCYSCVRECPARAIKVIHGQAMVIAELCVACGHCVRLCTQGAKKVEDAVTPVRHLLAGGGSVIACLAPSFPVAFPGVDPGKVISALRRLGFAEVWEVAFGAELIAREYARLARKAMQDGRAVISTACPAIVSYVTKYLPALTDALAPVVSPMVAVARAIKQQFDAGVRVVFIGPCIAKKAEVRDPEVRGIVDAALTYDELSSMFSEAAIEPAKEQPSRFDGPLCYLGRSLPISGGLLRAAGFHADILENSVLVTEGKDRALPALRELAAGSSRARLFDMLFCEGCINGPKIPAPTSAVARKEALIDWIHEHNRYTVRKELAESLAAFDRLDLSRQFDREAVVLPQPTEEEIAETLKQMRKFTPADQLNCGSCGYASCREKAIAVRQGFAEIDMCLPFMVEELEATVARLQRSDRELENTQDRLVQTERLASMGQISAGVAHEINNPLSTILLYTHLLLKRHREGDPEAEDIQMILSEATRCRSIMRGLLDFARQSRVVKAPTDLGAVMRALAADFSLKVQGTGMAVHAEAADDLPEAMLDAEQIRQMLVNLVQNGLDACAGRGEVTMSAGLGADGRSVVMRVRDTGCGMPPEVQSQIFTPFYTTKQLGKGTGMGMSIVYGVVKMHAGDISVESSPGSGTTFHVRLPLERVSARAEGGTP
jgi:signal transduction histidine kinase/Fe-S-cluster-containing hydrogenase component 2